MSVGLEAHTRYPVVEAATGVTLTGGNDVSGFDMEFATLLGVVRTISSIVNFVDGSGMADALSTLADVHLEAARLAMSRAKSGKDKRAEVWSAINHLQAAHVSQRAIWDRKRSAIEFITAGASFRSHYAAYDDACVCGLTAVCYVYVGEPASVVSCLEQARRHMRRL